MSPEDAFRLANGIALVGWLALLLAPLRRRAALLAARATGALLAIGYAGLLLIARGSGGGLGSDFTLAGISRFFDDPMLLLIGWVHYLAFDLWVGAWEVDAAERAGMPHAIVVPALLLTFLLGPVGLLVFLGTRALHRWRGRIVPSS